MEKQFEELYLKDDPISGESDYYLDELFKNPYNGVVIDKVNDILMWKFDVRKGKRTGLEYVYNTDGKVEQINECRNNLMFGVSKEYDNNEDVKTASIVYNNSYLKIVEVNEKQNVVLENYDNRYEDKLPEYLRKLLLLSNQELVNYEFKTDNPNLIIL
ncbi:hypothetical protein [Chryseobacterium sp.]|uniref:hypothetical protein n=1 Tax=Chryseobacterium sp. TaxID=1871047 RepID=UPI0038904B4F